MSCFGQVNDRIAATSSSSNFEGKTISFDGNDLSEGLVIDQTTVGPIRNLNGTLQYLFSLLEARRLHVESLAFLTCLILSSQTIGLHT